MCGRNQEKRGRCPARLFSVILAEPARLPLGAGGAVLNVIALLARHAGIAALRYAGPYPTAALWYPPPEKAVIGLKYVYLASRNKVYVNGTWDVVLRVE